MDGSEERPSLPAAPVAEVAGTRAPEAAASLAALMALLDVESEQATGMLTALHALFAFDSALVLDERDGVLICIGAMPGGSIGRRWPADGFFQGIVHGQVIVTGAGRPAQELPDLPDELIAPGQAAICLPVGLNDRAVALVMRRNPGAEDFTDEQAVAARQCAVVALAALAARNGHKLESEIQRLTAIAEELRRSEQDAVERAKLLNEIIDHLPISLTVQDENGRFILVNSLAASNLDMPADVLVGASPGDFLSPEEAAQRREWEIRLLQSGDRNTVEEIVTGPTGLHTWLTSHKPVLVRDRTLLLTSSHDITERKQVEMDLALRANFDELTGLPNRIRINRHVDELLERYDKSCRFALAFIDLDNFKHINDYYSHAIGDALLIKISNRIRKRLRDSDMLARISGDEFLLLLDPVDSEEQIRTTIHAILNDLKQPFHIEAFEVLTSASIGVTVYPEHGTSYEALRRNADNAMYRAKNGTKGDAIFFDLDMGQTISARMELEQRLRLAIRDQRFCCAFQPKVDIRSKEVMGFETLVRWRDGDGEIRPPGSFIGLAIELGLIDPITLFVMEDTLNSIERLDAAFGSATTFSINVAAKQASDMNFMTTFAETLQKSKHVDRIMLELTEDAFVAKNLFQMQILPMLREIGVRVSIDDFGTGYSSLSVLADITADELKVDRSFIAGIHERPRSQSVLRTIESLGHGLGMTIVAEGVESFEELAYLQAATKIRYAQGYYFSMPFFLDDMSAAKDLNFENRVPQNPRELPERRGARPYRGL
jgi:diguanylate cyclase (GGDEF)-like protein/PAS domain S-box-containing protein